MAEPTREQLLERAKLLEQARALEAESEPIDGNPKHWIMDKTLEGGKTLMKGMDYLAGTTARPAVAKLMGVYDPQEHMDALKFKSSFPSTSQLMEKKGVLKDSPVTREILGIGGDIVTDPTTYMSAGLSAFGKAGKGSKILNRLANPIESFMGMRGNQLYKKAFEELDMKAASRGKELMPSKILQNERFSGNMGAARDTLEEVNQKAGDEIGSILNDASKKGAKVDMAHVFEPAIEEVKKLRKMLSPEAHKLADKIEERVAYMQRQVETPGFWSEFADAEGKTASKMPDRVTLPEHPGQLPLSDNPPAFREQVLQAPYSQAENAAGPRFVHSPGKPGSLPVDAANREKSFLDKLIKDSGFDQGADAALGTQERAAVANSLRGGIPEAVTAADPALGARLDSANKLFAGTDNSIQKSAGTMAKRVSERTNPFMPSATDLMYSGMVGGGGALMGGGEGAAWGLGAMALKKMRDAAKTTSGRTARGKVATKLGNTGGALDPAIRRSIWAAINDLGGNEDGQEEE